MPATIRCPKCASSLAVPTPPPKAVACPECGHEWATGGGKTKTVAVLDAEKVKVTPAGGTKKGRKKGKGESKPSSVSPALIAGIGAGVLVLLVGIGWGGWLLLKPGPKAAVVQADGGSDGKVDGPGRGAWQPPRDPAAPHAPPPPPLQPADVARIFQQILPGVAVVMSPNPTTPDVYVAGGGGVLIHRDRRLVLTSYSLVKLSGRATVFFAERKPGGEPVADPRFYADKVKTLGVSAKVVHSNPPADLALLLLDKLPPTADVIPLAPVAPADGADLVSVGTADLDPVAMTGTLWHTASGKLRQRYKESAQGGDKLVVATALDSDKPVGVGDNGGPTVNRNGELVGMTCTVGVGANKKTVDIDLSEVRELVKGFAQTNGWSWVDPRPGGGPPPISGDKFDRLTAALEKGTPEQRLAAARDAADAGEPARKLVPKLLPLLDDADRAVRTAAADALAKLGDPLPADEYCLVNALAGTTPNARAHALRVYASRLTVPAEHVPRLIGWLGEGDADLRVLAAAALGRYGPNCREKALEPLARNAADGTPAVADAAADALARLGPYRGPDFRWLTDRAKHDNPRLRRFAVRQIGTDAETADSALAHLAPALADTDVGVRAAAAAGLERWGPAAKPLFKADALLALLKDADPGVRIAAAKAVGAVELQAGLPALVELVKADTPEVKAAAADALASLDLSDPAVGGPAVDLLLGCDVPAALAKVYRKLAAAGGVTKERVPLVARGLKRAEPPVRAAALAALAAVGPAAAAEAAAVAGLVGDADAKLSEAAIDALVKLGPAAAEPLVKCLDRKLDPAVKGQVCRAVGRYGPAAPPVAVVYLFAAAGDEAGLREAVGEAATAINSDDVSAQLRKHIAWSRTTRKRDYPPEVQQWAFGVIGKLDPNKLSDKERDQLLSALQNQANNDPDKDCRREAKEVYAKLKAQVKAK